MESPEGERAAGPSKSWFLGIPIRDGATGVGVEDDRRKRRARADQARDAPARGSVWGGLGTVAERLPWDWRRQTDWTGWSESNVVEVQTRRAGRCRSVTERGRDVVGTYRCLTGSDREGQGRIGR